MSVDGKGLLVIISAPSGGGKDVVIDQLVQKLDDAVVYVTATSRKGSPMLSFVLDFSLRRHWRGGLCRHGALS